jgi:hypothetical protein
VAELYPTFAFYSVSNAPSDWIRESDIPKLISLLDSKEKCANVSAYHSSYLDPKPSTVGREAAFLIKGFREGKYPPDLNSSMAEIYIEEIKLWGKLYLAAKRKSH